MATPNFLRIINPWRFKREQHERRVIAIRERDGDNCARCRRPICFDRPAGHDLAARIEALLTNGSTGLELADLCLTHGRCHGAGRDHTEEVTDRLRLAREAQLFSKKRAKRRAA